MLEHPMFSIVKLITHRFESEGAKYGMIGTVVEIYESDRNGRGFEVAFSDPSTGEDFAMVTCKASEIEQLNEVKPT